MPAELHIFGQTGQSAPAAGALNGSLPPHSEEAERSLLGSMIRDNATIGDVLNTLRDERNFYKDAHQRIFAAVLFVLATNMLLRFF